MIKSFADPDAEMIYHRRVSQRLPVDLQQTALRTLRMLNNAASLDDLRLAAGNHPFAPAGRYSIRIADRWRLHFDWRDGDIWNVALACDPQET